VNDLSESTTHLVAIDSSVMVGVLNLLDHRHTQAKNLLDALKLAQVELIYFDCVVGESLSTILRRLREKNQTTAISQLISEIAANFLPEQLTWILPDAPLLYRQILHLIETSSGELNFNDALIALACRERNIPYLASFDADFDALGWLQRIERHDALPAAIRKFQSD
jgi:predicted nucleic acid-binding protein